MRPYCTHALPNCCVVRGVAQASGSTGGFQRRAPTGAFANGTPFQDQVPFLAASLVPCTVPKAVLRVVVGNGSSSPPPQPLRKAQPASRTASADPASRFIVRLLWGPGGRRRCAAVPGAPV